ncbi:MAG: tetratricopeptide repeat protein [Anaerolineae bacterium]|jgi:tetratricopeptide (TPR) repeat protein|nr:tetratricopeptide repeat protein [Anaerolineae bacterium]
MSDAQDPNLYIPGTISGNNINIGGTQYNNTFNTSGRPICPKAPLPPEHFTGRADEIQAIADQLDKDGIAVVQGMGGVGKTSLAKALCKQKYGSSGAVLWADVTPFPTPRNELLKWFSYTGQTPQFPADATLGQIADQVREQLTAAFETLACGGRVLVVLDDVWENDTSLSAVKILRRAAPPDAKILLTTRNEVVVRELDLVSDPISLDELPTTDAKQLVSALTHGKKRIQAEDIDRLIQIIGGHPLALEIAAATLKSAQDRPHLKRILDSYQAGLAGHKDSKLYDRSATRNLAIVFQYSYDHLTPDEQRAFRWLGIIAPDSVWERAFSAHLWDLSDDEVIDQRITALCDRALIRRDPILTTDEATWYSQHPLLWRYALNLLDADEKRAAFDRYAAIVTEIAGRFNQLPPEDWGQLNPYQPHVRAVGDHLVQAYPDAPDETVMRQALAFAVNTRNYVIYRPEERHESWVELGLKVAQSLGDRKCEGLFLHELGFMVDGFGEKTQALHYYKQALTIARELRDQHSEATTLNNIGGVYSDLGDKLRALTYYEQALPLRKSVGDRGGEAATLNNIGMVYADLGDKQQALIYYEQALSSSRAVGDRRGEAATLTNMGLLYSDLGDNPRALIYYEQALPLMRAVGDRSGEAVTLNNIGMVYDNFGVKQRALPYYKQAISLSQAVGDHRGEAATLNNIAAIYLQEGNLTQAAATLRQIIPIVQAIGAVSEESLFRFNLAHTLAKLGEFPEAIIQAEQAIALLQHHQLERDAAGQTIAEMQGFLVQWRGDR